MNLHNSIQADISTTYSTDSLESLLAEVGHISYTWQAVTSDT